MYNKEREELNQRFIAEFQKLEATGKIVRNKHRKNAGEGISISDLSIVVTGKKEYGHLLSNYLSGEGRYISVYEAKRFADHFGIDPVWMIFGEVTPCHESNHSLQQENIQLRTQLNQIHQSSRIG